MQIILPKIRRIMKFEKIITPAVHRALYCKSIFSVSENGKFGTKNIFKMQGWDGISVRSWHG